MEVMTKNSMSTTQKESEIDEDGYYDRRRINKRYCEDIFYYCDADDPTAVLVT